MLRVHLSKHLETRMKWTHSVLLVLLSLALSAPGFGQWSKRLDPAVPRTRREIGSGGSSAENPRRQGGSVGSLAAAARSSGKAPKRGKRHSAALFHRHHGRSQ